MSDACCGDGESVAGAATRLRDVAAIRAAGVAGVSLLVGLVATATDVAVLPTAGFIGALIAGGSTFLPHAARGLRNGRLGVGTLMAIAAIGAVLLGELAEAATLAFLYSIAEALEGYAVARTRQGLRALLDLVPPQATVLADGGPRVVAAGELRPGDRLLVRPGERLATDGIIRAGRSALDFSAITGESLPVERGPGEAVYAAAINGRAALEVDVTASTDDNSLTRIVRMVEEAQERKGHSQRLAEGIARPLVPGVMVVAAVVAALGSTLGDPDIWLLRALVVLVAAAPCAFALSVPVTVVAAVGAATRSGVLIKGGAALEALARARTVALDKTGTLTQNRPRVVEVLANGVGRERLGRPGFVGAGAMAPQVQKLEREGSTVVLLERCGETLGAIAVLHHARRAATIMGQNLFLSGSILAVLVPLAATGVLGLAAVVAVHELAEVVVIANGIRAGRRTAFASHAGQVSDNGAPAAPLPHPATVVPSATPRRRRPRGAPR